MALRCRLSLPRARAIGRAIVTEAAEAMAVAEVVEIDLADVIAMEAAVVVDLEVAVEAAVVAAETVIAINAASLAISPETAGKFLVEENKYFKVVKFNQV